MKFSHRALRAIILVFWHLVVISSLTLQVGRAQTVPPHDSFTTLFATMMIDQVIVDPVTSQLSQVILFDGGVGNLPLHDLVVVLLTDDNYTVLAAYALADAVTDDDGYFTLTLDAPDTDADLGGDVRTRQSANTLALTTGKGEAYTAGYQIDATNLLDLVYYRLTDNGELFAMHLPIPAPSAAAAAAPQPAAPSAAPADRCDAAATLIHAVQGAAAVTPLLGQTVVIEGIVVGDFQNVKTQLRGFFVQEERTDQDTDPLTSEGIFVFDNGFTVDVQAGDRVQVRGLVHEFNTMTELKRVERVVICDHDHPLEPAIITLPEVVDGDLERYEGMLIRLAHEMTVAQNYFLGRYGQMTLAAAGRPYQPTNRYVPDSPEAQQMAAENARRLLVLDDGRDLSALGDNPNPVPYLGAPPPAVIRAGDTVTNLVGVLDYGRIDSAPGNEVGLDYRLQPIAPPLFTSTNPRQESAPPVGGTHTVASFNVLNYFNGDGQGGGFPTSRGAQTAVEFQRQRDKIIAALRALDADIVGLMEIENDGYGPTSAIQDLVNGLNATLPVSDTYAFIDPGLPQVGGDEITVGLIYKSDIVTPTGAALTLDTGAFDQLLADGGRSRQPLVQTFVDQQGERFTVAVNHFKSKRPGDAATGGNVDRSNGTGAWNERRTEAARDLVTWLATDPTGSGDPDFLIIGDLNAYAKETPITTIEAAGFVNLIAHFTGDEAYSYVFDGQAGYLDHALASTTLVSQTTGAADWHINTDEAKVLDYEARFNPAGYYSPTPFRASDHDPVLIGFTLGVTSLLTDTTGITGTTGITDTTGITETPAITGTTGITETPEVTDTTGITGTIAITDTTNLTDTTGITDTAELTNPIGVTDTTRVTDTTGITDTTGVTDTTGITGIGGGTDTSAGTDTVIGPTPPGAGEAAWTTYVVRAGDSLSLLARRYSVTITALARANGLAIHGELPVGRALRVPPVQSDTPCWRALVAKTGETLAAIADRYQADAERLAQFNRLSATTEIAGKTVCLPNIYAAGYVAPPLPYFYYNVQPGDTLLAIAKRYNTTVAYLGHSNALPNVNYLDIGQRLLVRQ